MRPQFADEAEPEKKCTFFAHILLIFLANLVTCFVSKLDFYIQSTLK